MSGLRTSRLLAILVLLVGVLVVLPGASRAAADPTPAEVSALLNGDGILFIKQQAALQGGTGGAFSKADGARSVHRVHAFTDDFLKGLPSSDPVRTTPEWVASLVAGTTVLGTIRATNADDTLEVGTWNADTELGTALASLGGAKLVLDTTSGAAFAVDQGVVKPLNSRARVNLPEAAPLDQAQGAITGATASPSATAPSSALASTVASTQPAAPTTAADQGWPVWFIAVAVGLVAFIGMLLTWWWRNRSELGDDYY